MNRTKCAEWHRKEVFRVRKNQEPMLNRSFIAGVIFCIVLDLIWTVAKWALT